MKKVYYYHVWELDEEERRTKILLPSVDDPDFPEPLPMRWVVASSKEDAYFEIAKHERDITREQIEILPFE